MPKISAVRWWIESHPRKDLARAGREPSWLWWVLPIEISMRECRKAAPILTWNKRRARLARKGEVERGKERKVEKKMRREEKR